VVFPSVFKKITVGELTSQLTSPRHDWKWLGLLANCPVTLQSAGWSEPNTA